MEKPRKLDEILPGFLAPWPPRGGFSWPGDDAESALPGGSLALLKGNGRGEGFTSLWSTFQVEAMVIPWVLDQTIVAMLSSLLPFYVQRLDHQDGFQ